MPLLEKAYAKLHGTYEDIMYHNIKECLVDMTGGISSQVEFEDYIKSNKADELWKLLLANFRNKIYYLGCEKWFSDTPQIYNDAPAGILPNHAYGVIDV